GITVTVRLAPLPPKTMFAFGTRLGLDEVPRRLRLALGVSTSVTVKASAPVGVSSRIVGFPMALMVGGSLTAFTVTRKLRVVRLLIVPPSLTVTVIVAAPLALVRGAKVKVPLPLLLA